MHAAVCCDVCCQVIKYGVVSLAAFKQDLQHWSHLYVGGRLHKPVTALAQHAAAKAACRQNLQSALTASLLLLPSSCSLKVTAPAVERHRQCHLSATAIHLYICDTQCTAQYEASACQPFPHTHALSPRTCFTCLACCCRLLSCRRVHCQDLFRRVASLSYMGDVRMGLAEDSRKVERIVAGSYDGFERLYLPLLQVRRQHAYVLWVVCGTHQPHTARLVLQVL
jgi:hypothetical protein